MQNNKEDRDGFLGNARLEAIVKRLDKIIEEHPEIVLKDGIFDYSKAPPEVRAEIERHLEEMTNIHYEEVLWNLAKYYLLLEADPSKLYSSLAEYLLDEKEIGMDFIPDTIIEDILGRFPELKAVHPKIHEALGKSIIKHTREEREFYFGDVKDEEIQRIYREVENLAKAGVEGVEIKREKGFVHVKYTNAPAEVRKALDESVKKIHQKLAEAMVYNAAYYYYVMLDDPSKLEFNEAKFVLYTKELGAKFVPNVVIADALNRFPELRKMYPEIAEKYKKFLK